MNNVPTPVRQEGRNAFGLAWFLSEKDAQAYAKDVQERGLTYNGGFCHGQSCGRERQFDYEENGKKYYAVSN